MTTYACKQCGSKRYDVDFRCANGCGVMTAFVTVEADRISTLEAERDALAECLEAAQRIADADRVDHPMHTVTDGDPIEFVSPGWRTKMGRDLHVALKGATLVKSPARRDARMKAEALEDIASRPIWCTVYAAKSSVLEIAQMYRKQAEDGQ